MFKRNRKNIFKYITIFDLTVLAIGIAVLIGVFFFFYRESEYVRVRVKLTDTNPLYAWNYPKHGYSRNFNIGDTNLDTLGNPVAKIIDIQVFDFDMERQVVYLDLELQATYDSRVKLYYFRGRPLVYGSEMDLTFSNSVFKGIVTESPESYRLIDKSVTYQRVKFIVRGTEGKTLINTQDLFERVMVEPEVILKLAKGKTMEGANGVVIVEIMESKIMPALRITENQYGDYAIRYDPFYKDAELILNVRVREEDGKLYIFDDIPLRSGLRIGLPLEDVFVEGTITEIF